MLKHSFFSIYRYLTIGLALSSLYSTESFAQNEEPTFSDPEWRVIAQYFDDSGNRAYYAETPGQLPLFSTAEAACEAGAEYVLPRLGASSDNLSPGYQQGMAYSDTRPFGDIEYILNGVVYRSTKGRKCSIDGWERGGSGVTSYDIFENSQRITTVETLQSPNGGVSYLYKKVWIGSISAIPDCSNTGSLYIIDGAPTCVSGGYSQYRNSPDCEGAEGDSPKSTPPKKCAGNPIAIDSGAKQHQDTDYSTADGLMSVKRKYRSNSRPGNLSETITEIPGFGLNWRGLLPGRITLKQGYSWTAEFLNDEGGVRRFSINDNGSGDFTIEATGVPTRLTLAFTQPLSGSIDEFVSGATSSIGNGDLRMAYANGDYIVFRRAGDFDQQGRTRNFVPIEHGLATGYKRWFEYPDTGQYPNKIRDSLGREMTIDWTEIGWASSSLRGYYKSPNQSTIPAGMTLEKAVSAIMLPDGTRLAYGYGVSSASGFLGNLETAKRFDASNDILWGRTYLYEDIRFKSAMTGILDQNGARLSTYSYNETGQATSTQRAGGFDHQQVSYSVGPESPENYDQPVDIRDVTNALGLITRYTYSAYSENYSGGESPGPDPRKTPRRLLNMQGQATLSLPERTQTYEYDEDGLNVARTDANGQRTSQENILGEGRPAQVTDATGVATQIEWHPIFDLPVREARKNLRTDYGYSDQGQLINITQTDTEGSVSRTTEISYGEAGRILSVNGPRAPDAEGRDDVTTMTYDTQGNRLTMTNPLGHLTSYEGYDANGRPSQMIDANGIATEFTYDALGRVKTTNKKHPTDPTKHAVTEMDYDVEGRVTAITGPDTTTLRFEYNLAGLMTTIRSDDGERIDYTHDPMGNVLSETVKRADGTQARGVVRTFDELGRLLTLTLGPDRTTRFQYDKVGNPTKITSARGNAVEQAFDPLNRLVTTMAPDGGKTGYGFAGGTLAATGGGTVEESVSNGDGNGPASELGAFRDPNGVTTRFTRNAFGEVSEEVSPDRGTIRYEYDDAGDLSAMVDGRGQRVEFTRDILGRVVSKTPIGRPQSERVTYTYDAPIISGSYTVGRLSQIDDGSGATRFGYDHRGNLVTRIQKLAGTPDWVALRFTYDLADRIETITYPSGRQVRYVRDTKGRVVAVRTRANNTVVAWTNVATGMSYEAFGALKTMNLGNGERSVAAYGDDGRVVARRLTKVADGMNISHLTYGYDADDNMVRITDHVDASRTQNFAYDKAGRLTRVTAASGTMRRTDYLFDGNGNRTRVLTRPLPEDPVSAASIDRYTLQPGTNQLQGITGPSGTRSFSYDVRGNLLTETRPGGVTVSAGYDGHGRLTSYARTGEASLSHVYNGLDDRVATTNGDDTRRFVYAPDGRVLGEYGSNASDVKAEFIWLSPMVGDVGMFGGDDGLGGYMPLAVAVPDSTAPGTTQLAWVHASHMGVPIRYSDGSGNTLNPPTDYSVPGFPGQSQTLADLYYNRYRDYDTATGRYIQADPIGLAGGPSPYSYAMNNPIRYTDPTGEFVPLCFIGGIAGGIGTAFGEALTGGGFNAQHIAVGAAAGCVAGVAAPFVATSAVGATVLGAITNVGQYAATKYLDGDCITAEGLAVNAALGGIAGKFAGAFKPNGMEYVTDVLPWMSAGTRELFRGMNRSRIEDVARRGLFSSATSGAATTILGSPF